MADIESLEVYVKKNPYHYTERWRLAKKIFKAKNYEEALVHLLILDVDWEPKASMSRYLAATLYRLDRKEEAINTLDKAIVEWPGDIEMYEQLAMIQGSIGRKDEAVRILEKINKIDPTYRLPQKSKDLVLGKKLQKVHAHQEKPTDDTIPTAEEMVCTQCGAANTDELSHCWQCEANLDLFGTAIVDAPSAFGKSEKNDSGFQQSQLYIERLVIGLIVLFTLIGGTFTYQALAQTDLHTSGYAISTSFAEWMNVDMIMTRIVLGVTLLVLCPFILQGAYNVAGQRYIDISIVLTQAMLFSTLAYALTWWSSIGVVGYGVILLITSFFIVAYPSWKQWTMIAICYCMLWVSVGIIVLTAFTTMHGTSALFEIPTVVRYGTIAEHDTTLSYQANAPLSCSFLWESTGSEWLDEEFRGVEIHITANAVDYDALEANGYKFELRSNDGTVILYETIYAEKMLFYTDVPVPGTAYTIQLIAESVMDFDVTIVGLTPLDFLSVTE